MGWTRQEVLAVARSTGQPVVEAWSNHNAGQMGTVLGPMLHHTGSAWSYPTYKAPTLRVVRDGRTGLENALSMYYIDYEGVIYCITEKIAWHAGAGSWQGVTDGNGHYAGIEAESDGQQWTKPTVASYKRLAAAILRKTGRTVAYAPRHADYALPPGRKTDFSGMDPAGFLADVNADLSGNPTSEEDELMAIGDDILREIQAIRYQTLGQDVGGDLRAILAILRAPGFGHVDVDEEAVAAALAPLITSRAGSLSDDDLQAVAKAVNDEHARRQQS